VGVGIPISGGVVARPCEASWELIEISGKCVCGPFVARGAKGEEEYPQHWLGGTGEVSTVGERDLHGAHGTSFGAGDQATVHSLHFL
jgi:hypothetical protein